METKIWVDGCFDLGHFGHANLFRQAKELGGPDSKLIVGIHSDEEIALHKRRPIFDEVERCNMVRSTKFVDDVVIGAPYITDPAFVQSNGCQICVHGSDITTSKDGDDTYKDAKDSGIYREVPRTQGISTTKLIKRVLNMQLNPESPYTGSDLMLSSRRIAHFSTGLARKSGKIVIYAPGVFDLFHPGHVDFLSAAKKLGDILIVGVYDDETVEKMKKKKAFMTLFERGLTVLGNKSVDEVIFGPPYVITEELMDTFKIGLVVYGYETSNEGDQEHFKVPLEQGKCQSVRSDNWVTTKEIVQRIISREEELKKSSLTKEINEMQIVTEVQV